MLIIDDLLGAPARGLMFVLKEINKAVQAELEAEERRTTQALSELHRQFEDGSITQAEFDLREQALLDQLEGLGGKESG
ncbi:MAG: gas vesicle protein GvpG [Caulobacteraceae bacterium]|nr:gas vesicle protein GvpG [Caulobacteraceae bacterium]